MVHDDLATKQRAGELWNAIVNNMGQDVPCAVTYLPAGQVGQWRVVGQPLWRRVFIPQTQRQ